MRADLLGVEGNPLVRIADLKEVRLVIGNGHVIVGPSVGGPQASAARQR
jgi:hypothetical protein